MRDTEAMLSYPFAFPKIKGHLISRLNRFVVEVEIGGRREKAYLANPGRLWELLLPGTPLLLSPALSKGKLPYTVLACQKEKRYILLHTHLTNKIIHRLIAEGRLPSYREYRVLRSEPAYGRHRFDLLLQHKQSGQHCYLEIKSCTLFEGRTAMFPDAVTKRGAEHLHLLKEISGSGLETSCLFVIMNPEIKYFMPAYHVDLHFARTLLDVRDSVLLNALTLDFDAGFSRVTSVEKAIIPYAFIEDELHDRGIYLLLLYMDRHKVVTLQKGKKMELREGCYVYPGAAHNNLNKTINRHKQKSKRKVRPIDHVTAAADAIIPVPVITGENIEGELAASLETMAGNPIAGFTCPGGTEKLFYLAADPLHNRAFVDLIMHYRLIRPEEMLKSKSDCNEP